MILLSIASFLVCIERQVGLLIFDLLISLCEFFVEVIDLFSLRAVLRAVIGLAVKN